jgi:transcriptional regulator with XRE-family HTH domain
MSANNVSYPAQNTFLNIAISALNKKMQECATVRCMSCGRVQFSAKLRQYCICCGKSLPRCCQVNNTAVRDAKLKFGRRMCARLRDLRIAKGISQLEIARRANFGRSYISKYENDFCTPTPEHFMCLAAALDVQMINLLDESIPVSLLAIPGNDEFLAQIRTLLPSLDVYKRGVILAVARNLCLGQYSFSDWQYIA